MSSLVAHAVVDHVYDGDSWTASVIPLGLGAALAHVRVRVAGMNAPESDSPEGRAATEYARTLVSPGDVVTITSPGPLGRFDNWGRILAATTLPDGRDWARTMIDGGYAVSMKLVGFPVRGLVEDDDDD